MAATEVSGRYRFGPLERRGLIAGWRTGQLVTVATGLGVGVCILRVSPSVPGAIAAVAVVVLAGACVTWPLHGRTAEEWAPEAARFACAKLQVGLLALARRPNPFSYLDLIEANGVAVAVDRRRRVYCAVFHVRAPGFLLAGGADQAARVGTWASALGSLARDGGHVHRLQWIERTLPGGRHELARQFEQHCEHRVDPGSPAESSYRLLIESAPAPVRHECWLVVAIHAGKAARAVRAGGGGNAGACAVLMEEVRALRRRLFESGFSCGEPLGSKGFARMIRDGFLVVEQMAENEAERLGPGPHFEGSAQRGYESTPIWPWPMAVEEHWGQVRADATWHATYWIAEWPRTDVGPDFLGPLLLLGDVRRSVSVTMEPVAPLQAVRQIEQARTADAANAELRARGGFLSTARRRREEEVLARREVELADGHAQFRFCGYATVTSSDPGSLERDCALFESAASRAGLEVRRCYGDQAPALACTMPLARGLP